jgi:cytochrome c oxidase subunit 4
MSTTSPVSPIKYVLVYVALMILLGLTFLFAHLDLGKFGVPVALFIASLKALLVVLYFMELRYENGIIRASACLGIFWLGIMMTLTLTDYVSRNWLPLPGHWPVLELFKTLTH